MKKLFAVTNIIDGSYGQADLEKFTVLLQSDIVMQYFNKNHLLSEWTVIIDDNK